MANRYPQKARKPKLATLLTDTLEPTMWDLFYCDCDEDPTREIHYPEDDSEAEEEDGNLVPGFHGSFDDEDSLQVLLLLYVLYA